MGRFLLLDCAIRHYPWGSTEALPRLIGRQADGSPWAEMWMGAHPAAPAQVLGDGSSVGLDRLLQTAPQQLLGSRVVARFGPRLPFLFKLLACDRPLSIQCHPDAEAAMVGFEREQWRGLPLSAPERNYRDFFHKPELLVALTDVSALVGFRPVADIARDLQPVADQLPDWTSQDRPLAVLMRYLLELDGDSAAELHQRASQATANESARGRWLSRLIELHPTDGAALAPLLMNLVELSPGQGIFLPPRVLHAYLHGAGLEIMASSDNVLRGGLTDKHVDVDELLEVGLLEPSSPQPIEGEPAGAAVTEYRVPIDDFALCHIEVGDEPHVRTRNLDSGPEVVVCLGGVCRLQCGDSDEVVELVPGTVVFVTAECPDYTLSGGGTMWLATVPEPHRADPATACS